MITPAIPLNEVSRLETLRGLRLLDTPPEERFDRLTRLARRLFGVSAAMISLVDGDRVWAKSREGTFVGETPRDMSFCGHAILEDAVMIVPDTQLDERFADSPLVTGHTHVRFYAGCPLRAPTGSRLGTLCLIDTKPRTLDEGELQLLGDLARMAEQEIVAGQLATMDKLTMLSNRRGFVALGQHALSLCVRRMERPASLLYFDLEGFQAVNEHFGREEGDRALVAFAQLLVQNFRDSDVVGRLGADEFVVLMTEGADAECEVATRRLQQAVDEHNGKGQRGYELRFRVGDIAYQPLRHSSIEALLCDADVLMRRRKQRRHAA